MVLDLPAEMDGRDLVELAVESVFLIMWRGVTGSDATSWKVLAYYVCSVTVVAICNKASRYAFLRYKMFLGHSRFIFANVYLLSLFTQ